MKPGPHLGTFGPLRIGAIEIPAPVLLAPMAGVTDAPFRRQAHAFGAAYTVSEMVASEQLARARPDMTRRAAGVGRSAPLVVQLAGREARWMALGAKLAEDAGADVIDINMGCPAKKVTTGLSGAALMRDVDLALRLIEATVEATHLPVTLKMRLGWCGESLNAPEIARRAEAAGVALIVVHGRTRNQFYEGAADWTAIRATVEAVGIPVIANGDIRCIDSARWALAQSGAVGVMVGRGAQGRAWFPAALSAALATGGPVAAPAPERILQGLLALQEDCLAFYGQDLGVRIARKHLAWTIDAAVTDLDGEVRRAERARLCQLTDPGAVREGLLALFAGDLSCRRAA